MSIYELLSCLRISFQRHTLTVTLSLFVLTGIYGVFGIGALAALNVRDFLGRVGNHAEMTIYLKDKLSSDALKKLSLQLQDDARVAQVRIVTSQESQQSFLHHARLSTLGLDNTHDLDEAFPASLALSVKSDLSRSDIETLVSQLQANPLISEVSYGYEWLENFLQVSRTLKSVGSAVLILFAFASLFVIGNLQRTAVAERADEITILELIGATPGRIRAPFLVEGTFLGLIASALATGGCTLLLTFQDRMLASDSSLTFAFQDFRFFHLGESFLFVILGAALGFLGSWYATRQFQDAWFSERRKLSA